MIRENLLTNHFFIIVFLLFFIILTSKRIIGANYPLFFEFEEKYIKSTAVTSTLERPHIQVPQLKKTTRKQSLHIL